MAGTLSALQILTCTADFFFLTFSLWLGLFIVTRSPGTRASWLAAATLWSLAGSFLNNLIQLLSPPLSDAGTWWWGWSIAIAAPFWYHLSTSLLPARRRARLAWLTSLVYLLALNLVAIEAYTPLIFEKGVPRGVEPGGTARLGILYPLFLAYLAAVPILAIVNFRYGCINASSPAVRQRFKILIWASVLALMGAILGGLTFWLTPDLSRAASDLSLGVGVLLLGYGVARWNALIEGYSARLDFLYTSVAFALVVGLYLGAAWMAFALFDVPPMAFLIIILLAVISHSLYDRARVTLDRWVYRGRPYRQYREELKRFAHTNLLAESDLRERLTVLLESLCSALGAPAGLLILRSGERCQLIGTAGVRPELQVQDPPALLVGETTRFSPPVHFLGAAGIALIVPLQFGQQQLGAIAVTQRDSGAGYSEQDLILLEDSAAAMAGVIHTAGLRNQLVGQIGALLAEVRRQEAELQSSMRTAMEREAPAAPPLPGDSGESIAQLEDALRHLHDYSYLGHQALARLHLVVGHPSLKELDCVTHVDLGKALNQVLVQAIAKLKPSDESAPSPPPREWHAYQILQDCYVHGKLNREVMAELFIGEGTFNRTRRSALGAVARALSEMERASRLQVGNHPPVD